MSHPLSSPPPLARTALALLAATALLASAACGDDEGGGGGGGSTGADTTSATTTSSTEATTGATTTGTGSGGGDACAGADTSGCDVIVAPSDDDAATLQEALIDGVQSGQTLCLCPGTYALESEISLTIPDVTVRGVGETREDVVLDFATQTVGDDGFTVDSDGFTIQKLTVKNSPGNGIVVRGAERVTFDDLLVTWDGEPSVENGAYAVYPIQCEQVLVQNCEIVGAADAGIYVGQSQSIIVRDNLVHANVAGIEIENSSDADVYDNTAYDNTAGILVFVLPKLERKTGERNKVHDNEIYENNRANFAEDGTIVAAVPPGLGMFVVAADDTEIHDNDFHDNASVSILVVSWPTVAAVLAGAEEDPETDQFTSGLYIHGNTFTNNGTDPQGILLALPAPVEDVVWDGVEEAPGSAALCLSADPPRFRNFHGAPNIAVVANHTTDTTEHECEGESLPPQDF